MFRPLSTRALFSLTSLRYFHSPYVVLRDIPLTTPLASPAVSSMNEKQNDHSAEPFLTHAGTRTYVVSEPDVSSKHYQVPSGAFPASVPYVSPMPIEHSTQSSSSSQHLGQSSAAKSTSSSGDTGSMNGSSGAVLAGQGKQEDRGNVGLANAWRTRR